MTVITVKKTNNQFSCVECSGHTGFAENGKDVLCSAISSVVQTTALGIKDVAKVKIVITRKDNDGYFKFVIPQNLSEEQNNSVDILIKTMILAIKDLQKSYAQYVKLEEK